MTYSPFTATGNGSTTAYSVAFDYINTSDVKAKVNNVVTTAFSVSGSTVTFTTAPPSGQSIEIYRTTDNATIQADFQSGSALRAVDLNDNFTQLLYVTQEATDTSNEANTDAAAAVVTANAASSAATNAVNTANAADTAATNATNTANAASTAATNATNTANTALSNSTAAVSTANSAASDATAAVSTANTASTNASNAVSTANTASTNATAAVNSANTAVSTANTASTNATTALNTANTASTNATTALNNSRESDGSGGFNTAIDKANAAVTTANTASSNATTAVSTANTASTNASSAVTTANSANATANAAAATVASAVFYTPVANFASFPSSPSNQDRIEVTDSTGLQSQSIIAGIPSGFTGSSDLTMRLEYNSSTSKWDFKQYFAEDPEARYMPKQGGTMTGLLTLSGAPTANLHAATKAYVDSANTAQNTSITTNTASITSNASNISTNTSNISTNTSNISTNTSAIATKMATAGGTFTGSVSFDDDVIVKGDSTNGSGELTLNCENNSHGIKIKGPPHSAGATYTLTLPNDTGTNGQALITNGSGVTSWSNIDLTSRLPLAGGTMTGALTLSGAPTANLHAASKAYVDAEVAGVVDSSPAALDTLNELAAALGDDANFATTTATNIGTKMPLAGGTFTGNVDFNDNVKALFGNSDDLQVYHNATHSYISNHTGALILENNTNDNDIILQTDNGSGGLTDYVQCDGSNGEVKLFHYGSMKLNTWASGVQIIGQLYMNDDYQIRLGSSQDLQIYHSGGNSYIDNNTGDLTIETTGSGDDIFLHSNDDIFLKVQNGEAGINIIGNGAVELYHNNSKKLDTKSDGVDITGELQCDSLDVDGPSNFSGYVQLYANVYYPDNVQAVFGNGPDMQIYHDSGNSWVREVGNGALYIDTDGSAVLITKGGASEKMAAFYTDGAAELYHNNSKKLETTSNGVDITGNLTASGNVTAYSDITLKDNIETIPNSLDKVSQIRGVTYNRKDLEDKPRHAGVIAQEVEKVLPEVISTDKEGIKSVAYGNLVGLLIESIKELKSEVDELKAKLEG